MLYSLSVTMTRRCTELRGPSPSSFGTVCAGLTTHRRPFAAPTNGLQVFHVLQLAGGPLNYLSPVGSFICTAGRPGLGRRPTSSQRHVLAIERRPPNRCPAYERSLSPGRHSRRCKNIVNEESRRKEDEGMSAYCHWARPRYRLPAVDGSKVSAP